MAVGVRVAIGVGVGLGDGVLVGVHVDVGGGLVGVWVGVGGIRVFVGVHVRVGLGVLVGGTGIFVGVGVGADGSVSTSGKGASIDMVEVITDVEIARELVGVIVGVVLKKANRFSPLQPQKLKVMLPANTKADVSTTQMMFAHKLVTISGQCK
jgi:hypothetical protein